MHEESPSQSYQNRLSPDFQVFLDDDQDSQALVFSEYKPDYCKDTINSWKSKVINRCQPKKPYETQELNASYKACYVPIPMKYVDPIDNVVRLSTPKNERPRRGTQRNLSQRLGQTQTIETSSSNPF